MTSSNNNSIIYIPNTWFSSDKINDKDSNHDCMDLCYDGYLFKRHRINKNSINWLCKTNGCNSSVTVTRDEEISRFVEHKLDIQHNLVDEQEKLRLKFNMDCKIRAETEPHISVGPTFNCEMWNHFETVGFPRTNNNLEGYNKKLSNQLSVAHPDIFKSITKFKEEETDAALKFYRATNKEKENENAPQRRKFNIINDTILNNHRQMLRDEEISIDTYTKYVSLLFELNALDKKKKKTQNDEDEISTASEYDSDESELEEFTE
ncbi:unnamed protein product [Brachionus calyciflorus]|uniref:FLYWCH-type domain-containing protein n=1 Tax=Brachionus calyciflorus TaxID=104777 RepID=A0A814JI20_9BILA|nr:unnamed protein product [Brachionus calyciflorus]